LLIRTFVDGLPASRVHRNQATLRSTWIVCLTLLLPVVAEARIVNVQSAASRKAEEGLSAELAGTLLWTTGNTNVLQTSARADVLYLDGPHRTFFTGRIVRAVEDGDTSINSLFEHLRYRRRFVGPLSGETFLQHEYDEFRRLALRALFGLGPRIEFRLVYDWEIAVGSAWMLEFECFRDDGAPDAGEEELNQRWSNYLTVGGEITEGIALSHTFYFQPRFDDFGDHRLLSETAAVLDVKTWLAVKLAFVTAYDSRPPAEVRRLDTSFTTSLLLRM